MNLLPPVTDNISELLAEIVVFTQTRKNILTRNVRDLDEPGFVPKDLAVEEFSELLNHAIAEHIQNGRLVLCDTANVKFGPNGGLQLKPVVDEHASTLLQQNRDKYIELQVNKVLENSLNQRAATQLLKQKRGAICSCEQPVEGHVQDVQTNAEELPICWDKKQE
jgi:flagellar basal body rod protein FlgB